MNSQPYDGEMISGMTKACERAEQNARNRSNERERSIVVSSHNYDQKVAYKMVEKCGVTYATSVADERGEECGMPVTHTCDDCGTMCSRCVEATCCNGNGHVNLRKL
jgi:hypothetical protein